MRWLLGPLIASFVGSFVIVRIFDYFTATVERNVAEAGRAGVFIATWGAITAKTGIDGLTSQVRRLRRKV